MDQYQNFFFNPYILQNVSYAQFSPFQYYCYVDPTFILEKELNSTEQIKLQTSDIIQNEEEPVVQKAPSTPHKSNKKKVSKNATQSKKDKNFSFRNQDKDRNIYSNIAKGFAMKVIQNGLFTSEIENLIKMHNLDLTIEQFYTQLQKVFPTHKNYFSPMYIREIIRSGFYSENFIYILKKIMVQYLKVQFSLMLLNSNRIKRKSKLNQMTKARELSKMLFE